MNVESATYYLRTYDNPVVVSASLEELLAADLKPDASGTRDHGSINRPATYAHF